MPSLPSNIKGSIGNASGMQRDVGNGNMPLNIAANDSTFAGDYKTKYMKFGHQGMVGNNNNSSGGSHGQRLMNLNNPGQSPASGQPG